MWYNKHIRKALKHNMKGQDSMPPSKPTNPTEMFSNENHLDKPQKTKLKEKKLQTQLSRKTEPLMHRI